MKKLEFVKSKIYTRDSVELARKLAIMRFKSKKIVFTNGCFDILHLGHIDYLAKAANLGDVMIVGLNTDESVRRIKGGNRPIQDEVSRAMVLASLRFIDYVVFFGEDTPYELIKTIQPNVLVKGADYKPEEIVGYDIVKARKGKVVTIDYLEGYSTTAIEKKILESR
ncbi:MAG TPA: D-glycero-beta-D-manno-heptose 1-phosphate adenylyltransferase [Bacteroidales bacterium]|nr:D-glycero-beta-D-manno-heptose 1-phosphate adenylyltransferase [Bacteroidales bacterium]